MGKPGKGHPGDWLGALEILELAGQTAMGGRIREFLEQKAIEQPELKKLTRDGLSLAGEEFN